MGFVAIGFMAGIFTAWLISYWCEQRELWRDLKGHEERCRLEHELRSQAAQEQAQLAQNGPATLPNPIKPASGTSKPS